MSKTNEEWREVVGYEEEYEVSNCGRVRRIKTSKILDKHFDKNGYELVNFKINGKHGLGKVHRLVAEAFIPNPQKKPCVDHINGIRNDNRAENLRWCTQKENLNFHLAKENLSSSSKIKTLKRNRDSLGRFTS